MTKRGEGQKRDTKENESQREKKNKW